MLGVARKGHLFVGIVFRRSIEEAEDPGMNQVVQIDMHGQIFMDPYRDRFHEREMLEYNPIAPGDLGGCSTLSGLGFHLGCLSF